MTQFPPDTCSCFKTYVFLKQFFEPICHDRNLCPRSQGDTKTIHRTNEAIYHPYYPLQYKLYPCLPCQAGYQ